MDDIEQALNQSAKRKRAMKLAWFHLPTFYQEFHGSEAAEKAKEELREPMLRYLAAAAVANQESAYSEQYSAYKKTA